MKLCNGSPNARISGFQGDSLTRVSFEAVK